MTAVGAFYTLRGEHREQARLYLRHGSAGRPGRRRPRRLPDRRRASQDRRALSGAGARRHGRAIRERSDGRDHADRPAERARSGGSTTRSSFPGMLSFLAYGTFHSDVRGLDAFPEDTGRTTSSCSTTRSTSWRGSARSSSALMALAFCSACAADSRPSRAAALGADARVSVSVHRQHRGLDDGGARAASRGSIYGLFRTEPGLQRRGQHGRRRSSR